MVSFINSTIALNAWNLGVDEGGAASWACNVASLLQRPELVLNKDLFGGSLSTKPACFVKRS